MEPPEVDFKSLPFPYLESQREEILRYKELAIRKEIKLRERRHIQNNQLRDYVNNRLNELSDKKQQRNAQPHVKPSTNNLMRSSKVKCNLAAKWPTSSYQTLEENDSVAIESVITKPSFPVAITPSSPVTVTPSSPVTVTPSSPVTITSSFPVTVTPSSPVTITPSFPVTVTPSSPVTVTPSSPVTITPSSPVTVTPSSPVTITPSSPVTVTPSSPVTIIPSSLVTIIPPSITPSSPAIITPFFPATITPSSLATITPLSPVVITKSPQLDHKSLYHQPLSYKLPTPPSSTTTSTIEQPVTMEHLPVKRKRTVRDIEDPVWLATAVAKGFLTRRLLKTEKIQNLIKTIKEAENVLQSLNEPINTQDFELQKRVINQLQTAKISLHEIFFSIPISERLAIISHSRMLRKLKQFKKLEESEKKECRLSSATMKSLERKKIPKATTPATTKVTTPATAKVTTPAPAAKVMAKKTTQLSLKQTKPGPVVRNSNPNKKQSSLLSSKKNKIEAKEMKTKTKGTRIPVPTTKKAKITKPAKKS